MKGYFHEGEDEKLHHGELDAQIEQARERRSKSKARARKASEIRWGKEVCSDARAKLQAFLQGTRNESLSIPVTVTVKVTFKKCRDRQLRHGHQFARE